MRSSREKPQGIVARLPFVREFGPSFGAKFEISRDIERSRDRNEATGSITIPIGTPGTYTSPYSRNTFHRVFKDSGILCPGTLLPLPLSRSTIGNPFKRKLLRKTRGSRREENGRRKGQFELGNTSCNSRGKRTTSLQPRAYTLRSILVTPSFSLSFRILNAAFSFKYSRFPRNYRIFNFHRRKYISSNSREGISVRDTSEIHSWVTLPTVVNGRQFCGCCGAGSNFECTPFLERRLVSLVSRQEGASRTGPGNISFRKITGSVNRLPMYKTNIVKRALYLRKGRERERCSGPGSPRALYESLHPSLSLLRVKIEREREWLSVGHWYRSGTKRTEGEARVRIETQTTGRRIGPAAISARVIILVIVLAVDVALSLLPWRLIQSGELRPIMQQRRMIRGSRILGKQSYDKFMNSFFHLLYLIKEGVRSRYSKFIILLRDRFEDRKLIQC